MSLRTLACYMFIAWRVGWGEVGGLDDVQRLCSMIWLGSVGVFDGMEWV